MAGGFHSVAPAVAISQKDLPPNITIFADRDGFGCRVRQVEVCVSRSIRSHAISCFWLCRNVWSWPDDRI